MKIEDDVTHSGHRERLINLILNSGIENVSDIQAVEFFLTYIIPRGDVNPLSHRLLKRFGNFGNIIDATENELMTIKGINKRSARKIKLFSNLMHYYTTSRMDRKVSLENNDEFLNLLEDLLRFKKTEHLVFFAFDFSYNLIDKKIFDRNRVDSANIEPLDIYNFVASTKPKHLLVAHNHPGGYAFPSANDYEAQKFIEDIVKVLGINLLDSLIVGNNGVYSQNKRAFLRTFKKEVN